MQESTGGEAAAAGRFYDRLRASGLSSSALAYGDAYIGQECTLTADEIGDFARRAGIVAGTSVLDIGSGTGGPACYLARNFGCRVLGVDVSMVGHAQAETRARKWAQPSREISPWRHPCPRVPGRHVRFHD